MATATRENTLDGYDVDEIRWVCENDETHGQDSFAYILGNCKVCGGSLVVEGER